MRVDIEVVHDDGRKVEGSFYLSKDQYSKVVEDGDPDTTAFVWSEVYEVLTKKRTISKIAQDILWDWGEKVSPHALTYLQAMLSLNNKSDNFFYDSAESVVLYGLANMQGYRTPRAKALKEELKEAIK